MKKDLGDAPLGIGGWLFLVGLRLFGGIGLNGSNLAKAISLDQDVPGQIIRILLISIIIYILVVLSYFIKRHKAFPVAYIVLETFTIIINISMFFIIYKDATLWETSLLLYSVALSILWIFYTLNSKRVKKTFVYRWNEKADQRLVDEANGEQL